MPNRTAQQEEQLRALQLERDFQRRAEEAANQQDDDEESNDLEQESTQRVQGLLRMAAAQDRTNQANQQANLSRANPNNQSIRGTLSPQPVSSQLQSTNIPTHTAVSQQGPPGGGNTYPGQNEGSSNNQNQQNSMVAPMSPTYGLTLGQLAGGQKSGPISPTQSNEERDRLRRMEELKRKQAEFDENHRKREEDIRQQQQQLQMHQQMQLQQQIYQQQQKQQQQHQSNLRSQHQLHPGMLRLDNLVINGPGSPPCE